MPLPIPGPGRPPKFTDPEEMRRLGEEYFELRQKEFKVFTISGLSLHLGLSGWEAFRDYGAKPAFSAVVKSLRARIMNQGEEKLYDKECVTGAKFHLSVLGMRETQVIEATTKNTNINLMENISLEQLTDDQLGKLADAIALVTNAGANRSGETPPEAQQDSLSLPGPGAVSA